MYKRSTVAKNRDYGSTLDEIVDRVHKSQTNSSAGNSVNGQVTIDEVTSEEKSQGSSTSYSIFNRGIPFDERHPHLKPVHDDGDIGTVTTLDPFSSIPIIRVGSVASRNTENSNNASETVSGEGSIAISAGPLGIKLTDTQSMTVASTTDTPSAPPVRTIAKKKKTKKCGRIQFESFYVKPEDDPPPLILCEMCAKVFATCYCEACNEVFCQPCRELCHLKEDMGVTLHPHEKLGLIRKLRPGDTSRVVVTESYFMPAEEVFEEDMVLARDLSQPHSLAFDSKVIIEPVVTLTSHPKYKARDIVLFIDPVTAQEAYGRIISEWDFRHGQSAPVVVRGALPGVYYVVQMIDFVGTLGIQRLIEMTSEPPAVEFPVLEGVIDDPLKLAIHKASEIDNKLRISKIRKEFGPKWHFKPANAIDLEPDDESDVKGGGMSYHLGLNNIEQPKANTSSNSLIVGNIRVDKSNGKISNISRTMLPHETADDYVNYVISATVGPIPKYATDRHASDALKSFSGKGDEDGIIKKMHQLLVFAEVEVCLPQERSNLLANERFDFLYKFMDYRFIRIFHEMTRRSFDIWKDNMEHLREVQFNITARRIQKEIRRYLCRNVLQYLRDEIIAKRHAKWKKLHDQFNYCSRDTPGSVTMDHKLYFATAKKASRFAELCRMVLSKVLRHLHRRRLRSLKDAVDTWRSVVTEFNEKNLKTSHIEAVADNLFGLDEVMSIATEQKIAFNLHKKLRDKGTPSIGMNSNEYMNVASMPMSLHRNVKLIRTADGAMDASVDDTDGLFSSFENGVQGSDVDEMEVASDIAGSLLEQSSLDESLPPTRPGTSSGAAKSFKPASVTEESSLLSATKFSTMSVVPDDAVEFPPWNPSDGMSLPPLPKVNTANDAASRLTMTREERVSKFSFEFQCEGPTKDSCWVIPGKVAMGPKLTDHHAGSGLKKTELTSQALMLIAGFSTYVSLLTSEEELAIEKMYDIGPLRETLKNGHKEARASCNSMFIECKTTLSEEAEAMKNLPSLSQSHPDFNHYRQRRVRALGRIKRAEDGIALAKKQMKAVPGNYEIISMPVDPTNYPTIHDLLPLLWELERRLAMGESLYIYSDDGHSRVGMICGCLLGRLYALTPYEALYRIQACHDSAVRERSRKVPVHCPALPIEKQLVTEVLRLTNRVYEGFTWRSHSDPESFADEHHQLIHGTLPVQGRFPFRLPDGPTSRPKIPIYLEYDIVKDVNARVASATPQGASSLLGNVGSAGNAPVKSVRRMTRRSQRKLMVTSSSKINAAIASEKLPSIPDAVAVVPTPIEVASQPQMSDFDKGISNLMAPEDLQAYFDKNVIRSARDIIKQVDRKVLPPAESAHAMPLIMTVKL